MEVARNNSRAKPQRAKTQTSVVSKARALLVPDIARTAGEYSVDAELESKPLVCKGITDYGSIRSGSEDDVSDSGVSLKNINIGRSTSGSKLNVSSAINYSNPSVFRDRRSPESRERAAKMKPRCVVSGVPQVKRPGQQDNFETPLSRPASERKKHNLGCQTRQAAFQLRERNFKQTSLPFGKHTLERARIRQQRNSPNQSFENEDMETRNENSLVLNRRTSIGARSVPKCTSSPRQSECHRVTRSTGAFAPISNISYCDSTCATDSGFRLPSSDSEVFDTRRGKYKTPVSRTILDPGFKKRDEITLKDQAVETVHRKPNNPGWWLCCFDCCSPCTPKYDASRRF